MLALRGIAGWSLTLVCVMLMQDLMKGLAASTGQEAGPEIDRQPFISGTFEYGVGRPAAKRKVCFSAPGLLFHRGTTVLFIT